MKFLEKNLEDIIWEVYQEGKLNELAERGLEIYGELFRQQPLGNYGTPDLIEIHRGISGSLWGITVYELKKEEINIKALMQACRYITALRSVFGEGDDVFYRIALIGASYDTHSDFVYLLNEMKDVDVFTYDYQLCGLQFRKVEKNFGQSMDVYAESIKAKLTPSLIVNQDENIGVKD